MIWFCVSADGGEDSDSVHSVFCGALDVNVVDIPWQTDIERVVDIQRGENQWQTNINPVDGGNC